MTTILALSIFAQMTRALKEQHPYLNIKRSHVTPNPNSSVQLSKKVEFLGQIFFMKNNLKVTFNFLIPNFLLEGILTTVPKIPEFGHVSIFRLRSENFGSVLGIWKTTAHARMQGRNIPEKNEKNIYLATIFAYFLFPVNIQITSRVVMSLVSMLVVAINVWAIV